MIIKETIRSAFYLKTKQNTYINFSNYTSHTGRHIEINEENSVDTATLFYSESFLDVPYQHRTSFRNLEKIWVTITTTIELQ